MELYTFISPIESQWVPRNLDEGHLDWYFLLLALIMVITQVSI